MFNLIIVSFLVMLIAIAGMAIGIILGGRRLSGTCGGLNSIEGLESACELCTKPCAKKRKALREQNSKRPEPF